MNPIKGNLENNDSTTRIKYLKNKDELDTSEPFTETILSPKIFFPNVWPFVITGIMKVRTKLSDIVDRVIIIIVLLS